MGRPKQDTKKTGDYRIINVWLTGAEKTEFEMWERASERDLMDGLLGIADGGFKVSFSHDSYNDNYVAALTAKKPVNRKLLNLVYIVRHSDFAKLLPLICYVFLVLLAEGEQQLKNEGNDVDW